MITRQEKQLARKINGPSQIERVRAARTILNGTQGNEALILAAFLDIFHPEMNEERKRDLILDAGEPRR